MHEEVPYLLILLDRGVLELLICDVIRKAEKIWHYGNKELYFCWIENTWENVVSVTPAKFLELAQMASLSSNLLH